MKKIIVSGLAGLGILGVAACTSTRTIVEEVPVRTGTVTASPIHPSTPTSAAPSTPAATSTASIKGNTGGGPKMASCTYKSADATGQVVYVVASGPVCDSNFTSAWQNSAGWTSIPSIPSGADNAMWCDYSRADDSDLSVMIDASENDNQVADGICSSFSQVPAWQSNGGENPTGQGYTGISQ